MEPFKISKQNFVKLEGISGVFNTVDSNFRVRFFSTYANSREANYSELLDELKPMRERLPISDIRNIDQVLQRDLDDFRISNGLVPYLLNLVNGIPDPNHIAFFPAILAVLMPKDYLVKSFASNNLESHTLLDYPNVVQDNKSQESIEYTYNSSDSKNISWRITNLKDKESGRISPLSMLEFDKNYTEILVLDGQHRANAFRVANDKFFTNPRNEIYRPYYRETPTYPFEIETNLPVTLICFEKINDSSVIIPDFITRRLFIDVNNNAKKITISRQVLLDDRDPSSILTNTFYSKIAENFGFSTNTSNLSLIHLGFDTNSSLKERFKQSILNISNPEVINFTFDWFFFATRIYNDLRRYDVGKNSLKWQPDILTELLPLSRPLFDKVRDEELNEIKRLLDPANKNIVKEEFENLFFKAFYNILNNINFLRCHYQATSAIQADVDSGAWSTGRREVWSNLFIGGEGLYYSFKNLLAVEGNSSRVDLIPINTAIDEVEDAFINRRASICGLDVDDTNEMFASFNTLAFQVSLFMAFYDYLDRNDVDLADVSEINAASIEFTKRINLITVSTWCNVFTKIRPELINETAPKKWPSYHKIILRLIQLPGEYFDNPTYYNYSPEAKIFSIKFEEQLIGFLRANYNDTEMETLTSADFKALHSAEIDGWKATSKTEVENLFLLDLGMVCLDFDADFISEDIIIAKIKN